MIFETSKIQQNEVDQETIRSLTARTDEQDVKVADLKARLEKCKSVSERLDLAEKWRARLKEIMTEACRKLEKDALLSLEISSDFGNVLEKRASSLDFTIYLPKTPSPPVVPDRSGFSRIEHRCNDLAGHLTMEKETFQELAQELDAREPLTFDLDDLLKLSPSPAPRSPSPVSAANEQAD